jgi:hypothetical protein
MTDRPTNDATWLFIGFVIFCLLFAVHQLWNGVDEPDYNNSLISPSFWEKR